MQVVGFYLLFQMLLLFLVFFCVFRKDAKYVKSLNPNKANGWDGMSVRMITLSDNTLIIEMC